MSVTISVQAAVERLLEARSNHRELAPLSETEASLTLDDAYEIQDGLRMELERRGERPIGWKLGATSSSSQTIIGVTEPVCGFLFPTQYANGADVPVSKFGNLGVEVEVAFKMGRTLGGPGVTVASALPAVEGVLAALELPDFMFSGKPRAVDFVANSVIANAIVLGGTLTALEGFDLAAEEVACEHNGKIVGTYTAAEVMGNPLNALAWLANHLSRRGLLLKAGDIVMAGTISKVLRPKAGDTVRASFAHLGSVSINVVP
jgi:2-keto-4-pentenoate hydratase